MMLTGWTHYSVFVMRAMVSDSAMHYGLIDSF